MRNVMAAISMLRFFSSETAAFAFDKRRVDLQRGKNITIDRNRERSKRETVLRIVESLVSVIKPVRLKDYLLKGLLERFQKWTSYSVFRKWNCLQ